MRRRGAGLVLVEHRAHRQVEGVQPLARPGIGELLDARLVPDRRMLVGFGRAGLGRILAAPAAHLEQLLGRLIIGLEHVVLHGPFRRDAVRMQDGIEVLLAQPQEHGAVDLGIAADEVVQAGPEALAARRGPNLVGLIAAFQEDLARVPVLALALQIVAALDEQDALAGLGELPGHGAAAGPRADDHNVVAIRDHAASLSPIRSTAGGG